MVIKRTFAAALAATALAGVALLTVTTAASANSTTVTKAAGKRVSCGDSSNGLSIEAVTVKGKPTCATARQVANAYVKSPQYGSRHSVEIVVDHQKWSCSQKGNQDEYGECSLRLNPDQKVQLIS